MKLGVYSIFDKKANTFGGLSVSPSAPVFGRAVANELINGHGEMSFAPNDYDVYQVGEFDVDSGAMIPMTPIQRVFTCTELVGMYGA